MSVLKTKIIDNIAGLGKLSLAEKQKKSLSEDLSSILDFFSRLSSLDTSTVEPMEHAADLVNSLRDDKVLPSFTQKSVLSGAKETYQGYFVTDSVMTED